MIRASFRQAIQYRKQAYRIEFFAAHTGESTADVDELHVLAADRLGDRDQPLAHVDPSAIRVHLQTRSTDVEAEAVEVQAESLRASYQMHGFLARLAAEFRSQRNRRVLRVAAYANHDPAGRSSISLWLMRNEIFRGKWRFQRRIENFRSACWLEIIVYLSAV